MKGSPSALSSLARRRDDLDAAGAWLEQALDAAEADRHASLHAARVLALRPESSPRVTRLCAALVREQRRDGGFDAGRPAAIFDAATTALAVEILCAEHARSNGLGDAIGRACARLVAGEARPDVVRALVGAARANLLGDGLEAVRRATGVLESEFDTHALQPLVCVPEAADRLHAWHVAAAELELDMRRHPAVQQCTLALIQRAEASAGELFASYTKDGRISGSRAETHTAARASLALFAVHDAIVGPRAAFAAQLVLDAIAARVRGGAVRASHARFAPLCVIATAHFVDALRCALEHAARPWTVPHVASEPVDPTRMRRA